MGPPSFLGWQVRRSIPGLKVDIDLDSRHCGLCLQYPDDYPDRISIALWLKIYEPPASGPYAVIMHNAGWWYDSAGYCLTFAHDGLFFTARHAIPGINSKTGMPLHQWHHITIYYKDTHTAIFMNGCPTEPIGCSQWERVSTIVKIRPFNLVCLDRGPEPAYVVIDELAIWYTTLAEDDNITSTWMGGQRWLLMKQYNKLCIFQNNFREYLIDVVSIWCAMNSSESLWRN